MFGIRYAVCGMQHVVMQPCRSNERTKGAFSALASVPGFEKENRRNKKTCASFDTHMKVHAMTGLTVTYVARTRHHRFVVNRVSWSFNRTRFL